MTMRCFLSPLVLTLPLLGGVFAADIDVCINAYIMDTRCINNKVLLEDRSIPTLGRSGPTEHTMYCLIDVSVCRNGYEILTLAQDKQGYDRMYKLDTSGNNLAIEMTKEIGEGAKCKSCKKSTDGRYGPKIGEKGMRATFVGRYDDQEVTGSDGTPPVLEVTAVYHPTITCQQIKDNNNQYEALTLLKPTSTGTEPAGTGLPPTGRPSSSDPEPSESPSNMKNGGASLGRWSQRQLCLAAAPFVLARHLW